MTAPQISPTKGGEKQNKTICTYKTLNTYFTSVSVSKNNSFYNSEGQKKIYIALEQM